MDAKDRVELERWIDIITEKAAGYGLDFYPTHFEVVPDHVIYELGSYVLPARFSHWTFGRDYHRQKTSYEYGMSRIYEIVFNTDPCQAFLLDSNSMLAHKFVVAHVLGHNDFFKNNNYFDHTDRGMIEKVRLHGNRIRRYEEDFGPLVVEEFLDAVLSIEEHFDTGLTAQFRRKTPEQYEAERVITGPSATEYDDIWNVSDSGIGGPQARRPRKFPPEPEKDLLGFLRDHSPDLEKWQRDILGMIREEMIYFIPQMRTKTINEGWACATADSLLVTECGLLRFDQIVNARQAINVASGKPGASHPISDFHKEENVPTIKITTRRGYAIEGALEHQIQLADGSYKFLKDIQAGDRIALAHGTEIWPQEPVPIDAADFKNLRLHKSVLDTALAHLLGCFISRGKVFRNGIIIRCDDEQLAGEIASEAECAYGILIGVRKINNGRSYHWNVEMRSCELLRLLESFGVDLAAQTKNKKIPDAILRSPRRVVSAFLRGYFETESRVDANGVTRANLNEELARALQILLLNFGIVASRKQQGQSGFQLRVSGESAARFQTEIGFEDDRKLVALTAYIARSETVKREDLTDEIVNIEHKTNDVYDITVEVAHAYAANGLVNHNSFWHERIMTDLDLTPEEHLEFRRMHAGVLSPGSKMSINPYYVGYNIFRDIERRWDGDGDTEMPEEDWQGHKLARPVGEGMKKIFEVRRDEADVSFLRKYLTQSLVSKLDMYTYRLEEQDGERVWVVQDTNWRNVRDSLLDSMTNFGIPIIMVEDGDFRRRGELLLKHAYDGKPLDMDYTGRTLRYIHYLWKRPVHIETILDDLPTLISFDGEEVTQDAI